MCADQIRRVSNFPEQVRGGALRKVVLRTSVVLTIFGNRAQLLKEGWRNRTAVYSASKNMECALALFDGFADLRRTESRGLLVHYRVDRIEELATERVTHVHTGQCDVAVERVVTSHLKTSRFGCW